MDRKNPNILPDKIINWWDIARGIGEVVFHGIFDQLRHEGISDHAHHVDPEDTLASQAQLFTPDWAMEARSRVIPFDSEGNYHNPDGDLVA